MKISKLSILFYKYTEYNKYYINYVQNEKNITRLGYILIIF